MCQIVATDVPAVDRDNARANDVSDKDVFRRTPRRDVGRFSVRSAGFRLGIEERHMRESDLGKSKERPINLC